LIVGARAIYQGLGGAKPILDEEKPTIDFAYACVVSIKEIKRGEKFTSENIWVKRPGTGEIKAIDFDKVIGKIAKNDINIDKQINWQDVG